MGIDVDNHAIFAGLNHKLQTDTYKPKSIDLNEDDKVGIARLIEKLAANGRGSA